MYRYGYSFPTASQMQCYIEQRKKCTEFFETYKRFFSGQNGSESSACFPDRSSGPSRAENLGNFRTEGTEKSPQNFFLEDDEDDKHYWSLEIIGNLLT